MHDGVKLHALTVLWVDYFHALAAAALYALSIVNENSNPAGKETLLSDHSDHAYLLQVVDVDTINDNLAEGSRCAGKKESKNKKNLFHNRVVL